LSTTDLVIDPAASFAEQDAREEHGQCVDNVRAPGKVRRDKIASLPKVCLAWRLGQIGGSLLGKDAGFLSYRKPL